MLIDSTVAMYLHLSISQVNDGEITLARHKRRRPMDDHVE